MATEQAQIRKRIDDWVTAFRSKDINGVMSVLAPEIVAFDIVPPLAYAGSEAYRKQWEKLFASYEGPIEYEIRDSSITAEHDVAFSHSINRIRGRLKTGRTTDVWLRMTACWSRINGHWLSTSTCRSLLRWRWERRYSISSLISRKEMGFPRYSGQRASAD
jgi:ketosteroid isomerase-like protein